MNSPGPLPQRCIEAIIRELTSGCRALVREPRIAFMGPMYSFSHLAAIHRFGQSVEFVPVATIAAVFEDVEQRPFGLRPGARGKFHRRADCRHARHVHPHAGADLRGDRPENPSFSLGPIPAQRGQGGVQQAASHFAVPQLAGQTFARRPHDRGDQHVHGRAVGRREIRGRGHRQHSGRSALRLGNPGGKHRRQPGKHHPLRRYRRRHGPSARATTARPCCSRPSTGRARWPTP